MNGVDPTGENVLIPLLITLAVVAVLGLATWGLRTRTLKPATNNYADSPLLLKIRPVIIKRGGQFEPSYDLMKADTEGDLRKASQFWKESAGIELYWDEILVLEDWGGHARIESMGELEGMLSDWYFIGPRVFVVDQLDTTDSGGWTADSGQGFAMEYSSDEYTIAHELGHVLIPRMLSHSAYARHVTGNPDNLMTEGIRGLQGQWLTQRQVDAARSTVLERGWNRSSYWR